MTCAALTQLSDYTVIPSAQSPHQMLNYLRISAGLKPEFLTRDPAPCNAALKHENLRKIGFSCRIKTRENDYLIIVKI